MKRHYVYLFVTIFVLFASSVFVAILQAQEPTEDGTTSIYLPFVSDNGPTSGKPQSAYQIPPPPPYPQSPAILSDEDARIYERLEYSLSNATPTPEKVGGVFRNRSRIIETPPVIPTLQVVDLDETVADEQKYEVIVEKGKTGEIIHVLMPFSVSEEQETEIIQAYVHEDEGDSYMIIIPPRPYFSE